MTEFFQETWREILNTSIWEHLAVLTSVLYVIFAAKRWIICWIFALLSSAIYFYLCFYSQLYIESVLQVFYFVMGIVGWILWHQPQKTNDVQTWGLKINLMNVLLSAVLTVLLGYIFKTYTDQASPFLDAFIFSYCLSATYMITKKVHEGWIYLIMIDILSIYLYGSRGMYLSSVLYIIYTIIAIFGWMDWYKQFKTDKNNFSAMKKG